MTYSNRGVSFRKLFARLGHVGLFTILLLFVASIAKAQSASPVIFFTDLSSGPNAGGENVSGFSGAYVTIYGNGFGTSQAGSSVTLNGQNCLRVVSWGANWLWYQKIVVQLGPSCSSGNFVVNTSGGPSNAASFNVRAGSIFCISPSGNDANSGNFPSSCWATMGYAATRTNAGDTVYLEDGVANTTVTGAYSSAVNVLGNPGGTA